jgi:hypothetical protein
MPELPPYIFDHVDQALAEIVTLLDQPNFRAFIKTSALEVQELETAIHDCIVERMLDRAVGVQLDQYGNVVGEPRNGLLDGEYRSFIRARISTNLSHGTPDEMTAILAVIGRAVSAVTYHPLFPAACAFDYATQVSNSADARERIVTQMTKAAPAGVLVDYIVEAQSEYFGFFDDPEALAFTEGWFAEVI